MKNKTIYLAIMTHGMSDFEQKSEQVQIKRKSKYRSFEDTYKIEERYEPRNPYIPPEIDYIQFISHAPLGSYNLSCPNDTSKSLSRLKHHISELNKLHGEELSAKLIELDDEVSPISLRNMNERKELKRNQIDDESSRENKSLETMLLRLEIIIQIQKRDLNEEVKIVKRKLYVKKVDVTGYEFDM